jgi:hypothetical protein
LERVRECHRPQACRAWESHSRHSPARQRCRRQDRPSPPPSSPGVFRRQPATSPLHAWPTPVLGVRFQPPRPPQHLPFHPPQASPRSMLALHPDMARAPGVVSEAGIPCRSRQLSPRRRLRAFQRRRPPPRFPVACPQSRLRRPQLHLLRRPDAPIRATVRAAHRAIGRRERSSSMMSQPQPALPSGRRPTRFQTPRSDS